MFASLAILQDREWHPILEIWARLHQMIRPEQAFRDSRTSGRLTVDVERAVYLGEVSILNDTLSRWKGLIEREGAGQDARYRLSPLVSIEHLHLPELAPPAPDSFPGETHDHC